MVRLIIQQTERFRIFIKNFRMGKKTKIIEYTHVLGGVSRIIYEEKKNEGFNYVTKDYKEQVQKNREFLAQLNQGVR